MKRIGSLLFAWVACSGLAMLLSSCVVDGARVSGGASFYYGPYHFWFYDRPWFDAWPWARGGIYIHPPPIYFGGTHHWPHIPDRPRVHRRP
jgi:hypothetical protein